MKEEETITFKQVEERLKNIPLEQYTPQDIFDRYIVYGTVTELADTNIQTLIIKNGYTEELINTVGEMITNETIISEMQKSDCFKKEYDIKRGIIENIQITKVKEMPNEIRCMNITLVDIVTNNRYQFDYIDEEDLVNAQFTRINLGQYIGTVVKDNRICCFLTIKQNDQ